MSGQDQCLWFDTGRKRFFVIPRNVEIPEGAFLVHSLEGSFRKLNEADLRVFEVSEKDASLYVERSVQEAFASKKPVVLPPVAPERQLSELIAQLMGLSPGGLSDLLHRRGGGISSILREMEEFALCVSTGRNPDTGRHWEWLAPEGKATEEQAQYVSRLTGQLVWLCDTYGAAEIAVQLHDLVDIGSFEHEDQVRLVKGFHEKVDALQRASQLL